nr:rhomboid family intramembrane serine protease [Bacillus licheniformis]
MDRSAAFLFSPYPSAGASGAIFGCLGALLYLAFSNRKAFLKTIGTNIIVIIILNLGLGFTISNVDNAGHIGGLIGGLLTALAVGIPGKKRPPPAAGRLGPHLCHRRRGPVLWDTFGSGAEKCHAASGGEMV